MPAKWDRWSRAWRAPTKEGESDGLREVEVVWDMRIERLADVADINPRRPQLSFADDDVVSFVPMEAVSDVLGKLVPVQRHFAQVKKGYTVFAENDVLFAKITPCMQNGKHAIACNLIDHIGFGSTEFHIVRAREQVIPEWIHYFLRRQRTLDDAVKTFTGTVGQQRVPTSFLEELEIPVPPVADQRCIAARLKTQLAGVEQARQAAQTRAGEIESLQGAIFREVFSATDAQPRIRLGDLSQTTSGSTPSRDRKDYWKPAVHPWVRTAEVAFEPITTTGESISDRALRECSLSLLPVGTVLVAMYGQGKTRGQSAVLRVAATTNQACFAILPGELHDPQYLQFWLRHSYQALRELSDARGGNQSNLNGEILNGFEVPLIPLPEQQRIVTNLERQLAAIEQMRTAAQAQLADIEALPARLLAQVFDFTDKEVSR